jgi:adenylate cyclase
MNFWRRITTGLGALPASRVTWGLALVFCVWALLDLFVLRVSGGLANSTYDTMVRARFHAAAPDPRLVIIDIDEASLALMGKEFGRWPWPRDTLATVLDYVEKQNAQAIAWDILFSDADRLSPGGDKAFDEAAKRSAHSHFAVVRLPAEYDRQSKVNRELLPQLWLPATVSITAPYTPTGGSTVALIPPVLPAVAASKLGYNNGYADADGVLRRYRMLETLPDGGQIQSLAVSVARALSLNTPDSIACNALFKCENSLFGHQTSDALMVWRAKANSYPRLPFAKVFAAAEGAASGPALPSLAGKIVLIGSTASSLHDMHPTPLGAKHAGVDSLATAIDNAVNQRHLAQLPRWLLGLLAASLCVGMAWWVQRHGISSLDAAILLLPGALLGISYLTLNGSPVFVDLHLAAGIALLFIASLRVWNGWRRNHWCSALPDHSDAVQGLMALRLARPAADVGLDALIRVLEQRALQCRVVGGDATATWPTQLRWPELHHTVAVAGPMVQLHALREALLGATASAAHTSQRRKKGLTDLPCLDCAMPQAIAAHTPRTEWAQHARQACAALATISRSTSKETP